MIIKYSQMHRADKYWQHSSTIWPVWLNGGMVLYELVVRTPLLSLKFQISRLFWARNFDIQAIIEWRFTLTRVGDMIITYSLHLRCFWMHLWTQYVTCKGCKTYSVSIHKIPLSCKYHFFILKGLFKYIWHLWPLSIYVSQHYNRLCCQVTGRNWLYEGQQRFWCKWSDKASILRYYIWRMMLLYIRLELDYLQKLSWVSK